MDIYTVAFLFLTFIVSIEPLPQPDDGHVRYRIHVPTKVRTVYRTKIIKVPQHHHYFYEKERDKIVKVPLHHHYVYEKEKDKIVKVPEHHHYYHDNNDEADDFHDSNQHLQSDFGDQYDHDDHEFSPSYEVYEKYPILPRPISTTTTTTTTTTTKRPTRRRVRGRKLRPRRRFFNKEEFN